MELQRHKAALSPMERAIAHLVAMSGEERLSMITRNKLACPPALWGLRSN